MGRAASAPDVRSQGQTGHVRNPRQTGQRVSLDLTRWSVCDCLPVRETNRPTSKHLRKVTAARDKWHRVCAEANAAYDAAIRAARDAGHTMPEIGQAAGITKQSVRQRLNGKEQT